MKQRHALWICALVLMLGACSSASDEDTGSPDAPPDFNAVSAEVMALPRPNAQEASRFLQRATFGPTESQITTLTQSGYATWLATEFSRGRNTHVGYLDSVRGGYLAAGSDVGNSQSQESFWNQTIGGRDPLRQRVAYTLMNFFIVSFQNSALNDNPYGMSSFHDMLARNAFGNFRTLLEDVSLHPAMGIYLSHLGNQREQTRVVNGQSVTQLPDENYAREIMQLFAIGLWELNSDGTQRLDGSGNPIPTYGQDEILGMAKVFTGFSWGHCSNSDDGCFRGWRNGVEDPNHNRWRVPMQAFQHFHSTSSKVIIGGQVINIGSATADLDAALDALFNHPNVGPFFGRQMIQRLVTSNPSSAYVQRVAAVFNNNGKGVRGDMKAVLQAVLLDPEARDLNKLSDARWGKLREPLVKYGQLLRAFNARPASGLFRAGNLLDPISGIGQSPYQSPSVFNFFRPDYAPTGNILSSGLHAPEFQITHEAAVTANARATDTYIRRTSSSSADSLVPDWSPFLTDATNPARLVDRMDLLLTANTLSAGTRNALITMLNAMPSATDTNRRDRVRQTVWVIANSPDYLIQK